MLKHLENTIEECQFFSIHYEERKNLRERVPPFPHDKCNHPEIVQRTRFFSCEPDIHEWCPYYNSGLTNKDRD